MRSRSHSWFAAAVVLGACSSGSSAPALTPRNTTVVATSPANGATDVEPDAELRIAFARDVVEIPRGSLRIDDSGSDLPGEFVPTDDAKVWRWLPERQLPRGNTVRVRLVREDVATVVAAFDVREASEVATHELAGLEATAAFSWPNGRRAVWTSQRRLFEVRSNLLIERYADVQGNAWTYGDGKFAYYKFDSAIGGAVLVRTSLDGDEERIGTPAGQPVRDVNDEGDAVVYVAPGVGDASQQGIWLLRADWFAWRWLGPYSPGAASVPLPRLDARGNVVVVRTDESTLSIDQFAPDRIVPRGYSRPSDGIFDWTYGFADDGSGLFVWMETPGDGRRALRLLRFSPDRGEGAFEEVVEQAADWTIAPGSDSLPFAGVTNVIRSGRGSTAVFVFYQDADDPMISREGVLRVENDGRVSPLVPFRVVSTQTLGIAPKLQIEATTKRGELWIVGANEAATAIRVHRSRPGRSLEPEREIYTVSQPGNLIASYRFSIDDSGRGVLVVNEDAPGAGNFGARIVVLE